MHRPLLWHISLYSVGLLLAVLVLVASLISFRNHRMPLVERQETASQSIWVRIEQLKERPFLPDHPVYVFKMMYDRVSLLTTPEDERIWKEVEYANVRLSYSQKLLQRGRRSLALTTATKAEKYLLSASQQYLASNDRTSSPDGDELVRTITIHKQELSRMKESFSDEQKAVVDRLIEQLDVLFVQ